MSRRRNPCPAFALIEVLIVIALMGILAGLVLPSSNPTIHDQLRSAAQIVATDLAYARSLAVTYGSTYKIAFDPATNCYTLTHSGADPSLNVLPSSPFRNPNDPPDKHVVDLDDLPRIGAPVKIVAVGPGDVAAGTAGVVEFGPLGETSSAAVTVIWLSAAEGTARRYITLSVNPVTGLATTGAFSGTGPKGVSGAPAVVVKAM